MAGFSNSTVYADNVDFTGSTQPTPQVLLNGQLLIGSSVAPNIRVATLTPGVGINIVNGNGTITISNSAVPIAGSVRFVARKSADTTNATGDSTNFSLICNTVIQNIGTGYNGSTGVFTVPTAGLYYFLAQIDLANLAAGHTTGLVDMAGHSFDSNPFNMAQNPTAATTLNYSFTNLMSVLDTVSIVITISGGTKSVTVQGGSGNRGCFFSGFLIG